jgi:hypothetical protein
MHSAAMPRPSPYPTAPYRFAPSGESDGDRARAFGSPSDPREREDLPYRVEVWNTQGTAVEQMLAVTANATIGYAAYYAATREYADRVVTLRHKNNVVSRWNPGKH